jgi:adenylosuccinate synthase
MRARIVIGANFGDEGKGLVTDYLCATEGAGMVVRFNGGAQAGHTVVTPAGDRHVFHHFGSGTFAGVPTFLSQFFVCNPLVALREADELLDLNYRPMLYAHPNCLVTTFADMMINQRREDALGDKRHGSVGVGFNETINRSDVPELKITMSDLWNEIPLESRLSQICKKYAEFRTGRPIEDADAMIHNFIGLANRFAAAVYPLGIKQCPDPVFEGAQGLLLDQDNKEFFPHLTRSHTGMKNVRILCDQGGFDELDIHYVSRTYLTKHGAGPLPGENPNMRFADNTNLDHPYQGKLRFAALDTKSLAERCRQDAGSSDFKLVLTHCDQHPAPCPADLYAYGPRRNRMTVDADPVTPANNSTDVGRKKLK